MVFEKSILQYKQGKWQDSRTGFARLIDNHSKFKSSAMAYMPFLSLKILEDAEKSGNQNTTQYREILVNDLKSALVSPEALNPTQKSKYLLQLGKTLYELEQYETALEALNNFIELYPKDENLFQAHLLSALCYQEGTKDSLNLRNMLKKF